MSQYTRRRFVAAGLGAATIGSLAGCSGSQSAEDTDTTESSTAEADTDEPTEKRSRSAHNGVSLLSIQWRGVHSFNGSGYSSH